MPITGPIPDEAKPVLEAIRESVSRPPDLPVREFYGRLRWRHSRPDREGFACPMGLHPAAIICCPYMCRDFPVASCTGENILSFGMWWDRQTDVQAAVDAVWPEHKT
ncbi:hypothetical protein LCGC14_0451080 [marine sediment metagenome]|uniref:Uncharacterized protein n=1 Tax=marine sediment metagenome TaxID=412755 RepID=A0A0F9T119_9ZZZZ